MEEQEITTHQDFFAVHAGGRFQERTAEGEIIALVRKNLIQMTQGTDYTGKAESLYGMPQLALLKSNMLALALILYQDVLDTKAEDESIMDRFYAIIDDEETQRKYFEFIYKQKNMDKILADKDLFGKAVVEFFRYFTVVYDWLDR